MKTSRTARLAGASLLGALAVGVLAGTAQASPFSPGPGAPGGAITSRAPSSSGGTDGGLDLPYPTPGPTTGTATNPYPTPGPTFTGTIPTGSIIPTSGGQPAQPGGGAGDMTPAADAGGGFPWWILIVVAVVVLGLGGFFWSRRGRSGGIDPFAPTPRSGVQPPGSPAAPTGPVPSSGPGLGGPGLGGPGLGGPSVLTAPAGNPGRDAAEAGVLAGALRAAAERSGSAAVSEQVERLLSRPDTRRDELVQAAIRQRDQLRDPGVRGDLLAALTSVGVLELKADGERFDPHRHETVDRITVSVPGLHDTVASTERVGYTDRGRVVRVPRVVLYWAPDSNGPFPEDDR